MTCMDLVKRVEWGEEFSFQYYEEKYWISQNTNGWYLTRVKDAYSQDFKTALELFNKSQIDGKSIMQIWNEIESQF